ncbi:hypothetical protein NQ318_016394 [Aromia moschata]|uniref:Uncharacterized protein n=1 Tax=Aromia moschata TaxID=1265417 RepID=A0AAV8Z601_9CUCU|nr:hypothetical protein NQ318_016394 [Aromia moschata]
MSELDNKTKVKELFRTTFSKTANNLKEHLAAEPRNIDEIDATWDLLQSKFEELGVLDGAIFELLLTTASEEDLEMEIERRDEYFKKFSELRATMYKIKVNATQGLRSVESQSDAGTGNSKASGVMSGKRKFKLPHIEFKPYDGSIKGWLAFWAQFRKIHEDVSIDDNGKIEYLLQIMYVGVVPDN